MRIDSSSIGMESVVRQRQLSVKTGKFSFREYAPNEELNGDLAGLLGEDSAKETEQKEKPEEEKIQNLKESMESMAVRRVEIPSVRDDFFSTFRQYVAKYIMMLLFGEEKTGDLFKDLQGELQGKTEHAEGGNATMQIQPLSLRVLSYEETEYYEEEQNLSFVSTGLVKTADGREINFNVDINMSDSFSTYYRQEMDLANFARVCDPLVINFDTGCAKLEDQKFFFDLDADGEQEEIAMLSAGSGFLALDKNNDGVINDGSELFGPQSQDGFADLAAYDEDGNGWIDENDSIWSSLKIWCQTPSGNQELYSLSEKGVGAICLTKVGTQFAYKDQERADMGYLRSTGVFLFEDGRAGTVQHLDLVR